LDRHVRNANEDGLATRGWFVGEFIPPQTGGIRSTPAFETKWCVCRAGDRRTTPACTSSGSTLVILICGQLRLIFDDGDAVLTQSGDYVLWNGHTQHNWTAETDSVVITFRTPTV
jgi:hypothetical protein